MSLLRRGATEVLYKVIMAGDLIAIIVGKTTDKYRTKLT